MGYYYKGGKKYSSKSEYKRQTGQTSKKSKSKSSSSKPSSSGIVITSKTGQKYTVSGGARVPITTTQAKTILSGTAKTTTVSTSSSRKKTSTPTTKIGTSTTPKLQKTSTGVSYVEIGGKKYGVSPEAYAKGELPTAAKSAIEQTKQTLLSKSRDVAQTVLGGPSPEPTPTPTVVSPTKKKIEEKKTYIPDAVDELGQGMSMWTGDAYTKDTSMPSDLDLMGVPTLEMKQKAETQIPDVSISDREKQPQIKQKDGGEVRQYQGFTLEVTEGKPKIVQEKGKTYVQFGNIKKEWSEREFSRGNVPEEIYDRLPKKEKENYYPGSRTVLGEGTVLYGAPGKQMIKVTEAATGREVWTPKSETWSLPTAEGDLVMEREEGEVPLEKTKEGISFVEIGGKKYGITPEAWTKGELPGKAFEGLAGKRQKEYEEEWQKAYDVAAEKDYTVEELFQPEWALAGPGGIPTQYVPPLQYNPNTGNNYIEYGGKTYPWSQADYDAGKLPTPVKEGLIKDIEAGKAPVFNVPTTGVPILEPTKTPIDEAEKTNYQTQINDTVKKLEAERNKGIFANQILIAGYLGKISRLKAEAGEKYPELEKEADSKLGELGVKKKLPDAKYTEDDFSKVVKEIDSYSDQAAEDAGWRGKKTLTKAESKMLDKGVLKYNQRKVSELVVDEYTKRQNEQERLASEIDKINEDIKAFNIKQNSLNSTYDSTDLDTAVAVLNARADGVLIWEERAKATQSPEDIAKYEAAYDKYLEQQQIVDAKNAKLENLGYYEDAEDLNASIDDLKAKSELAKKYSEEITRLQNEKEHIKYLGEKELEDIKELDYFYRRKKEAKKQTAEAYKIEDKYAQRRVVALAKTQEFGLGVAEDIKGVLKFVGGGAAREAYRDIDQEDNAYMKAVKGLAAVNPVGQAYYRSKSMFGKEYEDQKWSEAVDWEEIKGGVNLALAVAPIKAGAAGKFAFKPGAKIAAKSMIKAHPWATRWAGSFVMTTAGTQLGTAGVQEIGAETASKEEQKFIRDVPVFEKAMRAGMQSESQAVSKKGWLASAAHEGIPGVPLIFTGEKDAFSEGVKQFYKDKGYSDEDVETAVSAAQRQRKSGYIGEAVGVLGANIGSELLGRGVLTKQAGAVTAGKVSPWTAAKRIGSAGFIEGYAAESATQIGRYQEEDIGARFQAAGVGAVTAGALGAGLAHLRGGGRLTGKARPWSKITGPAKASLIEKGLYFTDPWEYFGDISASGYQAVAKRLGKKVVTGAGKKAAGRGAGGFVAGFTQAFGGGKTQTMAKDSSTGKRIKTDVIIPSQTEARAESQELTKAEIAKAEKKAKTMVQKKTLVPGTNKPMTYSQALALTETQARAQKQAVTYPYTWPTTGTQTFITSLAPETTVMERVSPITPAVMPDTRPFTEIQPYIRDDDGGRPYVDDTRPVVDVTITQQTQPFTDVFTDVYTDTYTGTMIPGAPPIIPPTPGSLTPSYGYPGAGKGAWGWNIKNLIRDIAGEWRQKQLGTTGAPLFTPIRGGSAVPTVPSSKQRAQNAVDKLFGTRKKLVGKDIRKLI